METTTPAHGAFTKVLAIIGFFSVIAFFVWALVQGVRVFPHAFSSLASIAETVGDYRNESELAFDIDKSIVNSGETFTVTWTDMGRGEYAFTHACTPGTRVRVRTDEGILQNIPCGESLSLPHSATGLFLNILSEEQRFSDVPMTIAFTSDGGDTHTTDTRITIVNASVTGTQVRTIADEVTPRTVPKRIDLPTEPSIQSNPSTTSSLQPTAQAASPIVSLVPKSYPNGFIDLRAQYLGVGTLINGTFTPKATFNSDDTAAFKFEVKNIGTRMSDTWSYELMLPGNVKYTSDPQAGLAPNEKAVFTVGFELSDTSKSAVKISGEVKTTNDTRTDNNTFDWSVKVGQ